MERQFVIFMLDNEAYGVEIAAVQSIIKMQAITRLPHMPGFIEGVTNLRGKVLPVLDLRKRLGLNASTTGTDARIMIAELDQVTTGMVVDSVDEVLLINDDVIEPAPPFTASIGNEFIQGIAKTSERLVILLDLAHVLNTSEQASLMTIA